MYLKSYYLGIISYFCCLLSHVFFLFWLNVANVAMKIAIVALHVCHFNFFWYLFCLHVMARLFVDIVFNTVFAVHNRAYPLNI